MNRGSEEEARGLALQVQRFNEAPIHESGKSRRKSQRKAKRNRLQ